MPHSSCVAHLRSISPVGKLYSSIVAKPIAATVMTSNSIVSVALIFCVCVLFFLIRLIIW